MKKVKYLGLIMIMALILTGCGKSSKNVAEQYCNILVKGNYGDILDIAYLPKSDFITKDKIKEAKQKYYEEMSKNNNNITSCEASQTNEDDKKIYYKLIKNGTDTENIEIDKETNKIIIEDLYVNSEIKIGDGTTAYLDGIELKNSEKQPLVEPGKTRSDFADDDEYEYYLKQLKQEVYVYKITSLKHADYKIKYTHVFFKDKEEDLCRDTEHCTNKAYLTGNWQSEEKVKNQELLNNLKNMFKEIALVGFEGKDRTPLNKYFSSSDSMKYIDIFKKERKKGDGHNVETYTYKRLDDDNTIMFTSVWYIADNEIKLEVQVNYKADISHWFKGTEEGGACVIATVTLKEYKGSWQIVSFEDVIYG